MVVNPKRYELLSPYKSLIAKAGLKACRVMSSTDVLNSCVQRQSPMTFAEVEHRLSRVLEACANHIDARASQGRAPGLFRVDLPDPLWPTRETAFALKVIADKSDNEVTVTICYPDEYFLDPEEDRDLLAVLGDTAPDDTNFEVDLILHEDGADWHPAYAHGWVYDEDSAHMAN